MSLYRQQLKLIKSMIDGKDGIELLTADKSQGRDKECIIISMVRSNDKQQVKCTVFLPPYDSQVPPDGRPFERLEADQRGLYSSPFQIDHPWFKKDISLVRGFRTFSPTHG